MLRECAAERLELWIWDVVLLGEGLDQEVANRLLVGEARGRGALQRMPEANPIPDVHPLTA
jgi:hypothetical protein